LGVLHNTQTDLLQILAQEARRAFSRARAKTGNKIAARIAIIAMTTRSSMSVNPKLFRETVFMQKPPKGFEQMIAALLATFYAPDSI
jgi:hypothetical protein